VKALFRLLSALIPGLGQALRGKRTAGLVFFLLTVPPLAVTALLYYTHMRDPVIVAFGSIDEHMRRLDALRLRYLLVSLPSLVAWAVSVLHCFASDKRGSASDSSAVGILQG